MHVIITIHKTSSAKVGLNTKLALPSLRINLQEGNINKILDPIVKASNPNLDALWKVAKISIQCVEPKAIHTPIMTKVVGELQTTINLQEDNALPSNYSHSMICEIQDQSRSQMVLMSP